MFSNKDFSSCLFILLGDASKTYPSRMDYSGGLEEILNRETYPALQAGRGQAKTVLVVPASLVATAQPNLLAVALQSRQADHL